MSLPGGRCRHSIAGIRDAAWHSAPQRAGPREAFKSSWNKAVGFRSCLVAAWIATVICGRGRRPRNGISAGRRRASVGPAAAAGWRRAPRRAPGGFRGPGCRKSGSAGFPLDGHDDRAVDRVHGGQHSVGPWIEANGAGRAVADAHAAAQAHARVQGCGGARIRRPERHRPGRPRRIAAAAAAGFIDSGDEIRGVHRMEEAETPRGDHRLAAAAAAVADEVDLRAHVFAELHQVVRRGPAAAGRGLAGIDRPGVAVPGQAPPAEVLKVMQISSGAAQARPRCSILWRQ